MLSVCYGIFAGFDVTKDSLLFGASCTVHGLFPVMALVVIPEDSMLQLKSR